MNKSQQEKMTHLTQLRLFSLRLTVILFLGLLAPVQSSAQHINDPLEPMNRAIFAFNDTVDVYLLTPVARGYDSVLPNPVKTGISNFFENLGFPIYFVSDIVQLKFGQAAHHTGRFLVNTTVGLAGFIDVAKHIDLPAHREDFGVALGYHGVPTGPYLVLPLLGPSNVRDLFGRIVDAFLTPTYYIDEPVAIGALTVLEVVDNRRKLLPATDTARETTLDYYTWVQSSYMQSRLGLIYDGDIPPEELEEEFHSMEESEAGANNPPSVENETKPLE